MRGACTHGLCDLHPLHTNVDGLPRTHSNVDTLLKNPSKHPLPAWHPDLESMLTHKPAVVFTTPVNGYHPDIGKSYSANSSLPSLHPKISSLISKFLPASHPDVDALFANPALKPLPAWHPPINSYIAYTGVKATPVSVHALMYNTWICRVMAYILPCAVNNAHSTLHL